MNLTLVNSYIPWTTLQASYIPFNTWCSVALVVTEIVLRLIVSEFELCTNYAQTLA